MYILIPAYQPDFRLQDLVCQLKKRCDYPIVIVNDGSEAQYEPVFDAVRKLGCTVLRHTYNQGKGMALKTGFSYIRLLREAEGVVCADSDGQHLPEDILRVAAAVKNTPGCIVMGTRRFVGRVPFRSRFGNNITRMMFAFSTGKMVHDTQTGLRGYSADMLDWLCSIPGERYEYEMIMLLEAPGSGFGFKEVGIDTLYLEENQSSHFHAIKDSFRVYIPILKFCTSSLLSFVLDFALLMILSALSGNLLMSVTGARAVSSVFNYSLNKVFVFRKGHSRLSTSLPKYFGLVVIILFFNYLLMALFHQYLGIALAGAKLMTETLLFFFSYLMQRVFVFKEKGHTGKVKGHTSCGGMSLGEISSYVVPAKSK